jgi:ribose/xylose/arabinose/galactoside ABC-type transport system permease subunit
MKTMKLSEFASKYMLFILFAALCTLFSIASPYFLSVSNLTNIFVQQSYVIVAAVGLSFIMISGGMDLSIGYQMSLVGVITSILMINLGWPVYGAVAVGLVLGAALGLFNGFMANTLRVHPLIVTLGTSTMYQGLSYTISGSKQIINLPLAFKFLGQGYVFTYIPVSVIIMLVVVLTANFVLNRTYFGRYVYALGSNQEAARLAGINVKKMKLYVFSICGFIVALAAMILFARSGSAQSSTGPGTEFTCMTAAILGGISFVGGEGKIGGVVVGVLLLGVLGNGMQLINMGTYVQYIIKGLVLLGAVGFDIYQKEKAKQVKKVAAV